MKDQPWNRTPQRVIWAHRIMVEGVASKDRDNDEYVTSTIPAEFLPEGVIALSAPVEYVKIEGGEPMTEEERKRKERRRPKTILVKCNARKVSIKPRNTEPSLEGEGRDAIVDAALRVVEEMGFKYFYAILEHHHDGVAPITTVSVSGARAPEGVKL